jgi:hypothetical protein
MGSAGLLSADGATPNTNNQQSAASGANSHRLISPYQDEAAKFITQKAQTARSPQKANLKVEVPAKIIEEKN